MPRYHFHILQGVDLRDYRGTELSDDNEARRYAEEMAGTLARRPGDENRRIKVTDETGREVLALPVPKN